MKRWVVAGLLVFAACAHIPTVCANPARTTTAPVDESMLRIQWEARFGRIPASCDSMMPWVVVPDADEPAICGSHTAGCLVDNYGCPVAFAMASNAGDRGLFVHELAHRLLACKTGDGDREHKTVDVWGEGGWVPTMRMVVQ